MLQLTWLKYIKVLILLVLLFFVRMNLLLLWWKFPWIKNSVNYRTSFLIIFSRSLRCRRSLSCFWCLISGTSFRSSGPFQKIDTLFQKVSFFTFIWSYWTNPKNWSTLFSTTYILILQLKINSCSFSWWNIHFWWSKCDISLLLRITIFWIHFK